MYIMYILFPFVYDICISVFICVCVSPSPSGNPALARLLYLYMCDRTRIKKEEKFTQFQLKQMHVYNT